MLREFWPDLLFGLALILFVIVMIWWDTKRESKKWREAEASNNPPIQRGRVGAATDIRRKITDLKIESSTDGSTVLSWNEPLEAPSDYRVVWARESEPFPEHTNIYGNAYSLTNELIFESDVPGIRYKVRVKARYGSSFGPWSEEVVWLESTPGSSNDG